MLLSRPFFTIVFLLVFSSNISANDELINKVQNRIDKVDGFSAEFFQVNYIAFQERKIEGMGKIDYLKPSMKWEYYTPDKQLVILGKEKVWIYDPVLENVTVQDIKKVASATSLSFLVGEGKLKKNFLVVTPQKDFLDSSKTQKKLFLRPRKKGQNFVELQLGIEAKTFQIHQLVIVEQQGNYRKITFKDLNYSSKLTPKDFVFQIKDYMEVIKE